MRLNMRLLTQNTITMAITVLFTLFLSLLFIYIHAGINNIPLDDMSSPGEVVAVAGGEVIYNSGAFSPMQIKDILHNADNEDIVINGKEYRIHSSELKKGEERFTIIRLTPVFLYKSILKAYIFAVIIIFLLTFLISNFLVIRYNNKTIVRPIAYLKKETERLSDGDLSREIAEGGFGEIKELGRAIENLRLKLKESVLNQKKYDDNRKFLLSSISHDLKTPITASVGYMDGVLDKVANTPKKQESYLKKAKEKMLQLSMMIDDLLLYSKLDLNQLPFDFEVRDIYEYMKTVLEDYVFIFKGAKKELTLINNMEKNWTVIIDGKRFARVVQNILDNGLRHIKEDTGRVLVILRETTSSVILEFKDNGEGMDKEELPKIFDRFYTGDVARRIEGSGGLGLAIAKQIVTGLGGRIWAVSNPGQGTSIMISFKKGKTG